MNFIKNKQIIKDIFTISMISVLMGQFYLSPFNIGFRLTLAVFFMSLFLIYFKDYSIILITMSVGISTSVFRTLVFYLGNDIVIFEAIKMYTPVLFYYLFFGIFFKILDVRNLLDKPFQFFISLWICDAVPNIIEVIIRKAWQYSEFNKLIVTIIIVGALRTIVLLLAYYLTSFYYDKEKLVEREKYYREIIVFISKLKTELFILKKSRNDIENAVAYTHNYYDTIDDENLKKPILKIAKDIHEIKKDYLRVIAGMNSIFDTDTEIKEMTIEEILLIVKEHVINLVKQKNKKIDVYIEYNEMFKTKEFYTIISVLNNLTVNSIDAINNYGKIFIVASLKDDEILFVVEDTGEGIKNEKKEVVFNSGYTTKYDKETGKMSTGLGLSHIWNIVVENYNGTIDIESELNIGTKFLIKIPSNKIILGGDADEIDLYC